MKIKHLNIALLALLTASCADEVTPTSQNDFLEGNEKTPIKVSALLDVQKAQTRAADKTFDNNDQLIAYFRHVKWNGETTGDRTVVTADKSPKLVTFTKGSTDMTAYSGSEITPIGTGVALGLSSTNTKQATDLTATPTLYWDDFSNSASEDTDLRTTGHYLQSYYGYCYNGGTPSTALAQADGTLGWTVAQNQSAGFKTSDLLWSYEQTPVAYSHATFGGGTEHGQIILPYTHAMSKVTIEVVCKDGFENKATNFSAASITLNDVNTVVSCDAPKAELSGFGTPTTVTMQKGTVAADNKSCSFTALIAPTVFVKDKELATISGIDGNKYTLKLSDEVLKTAATTTGKAWNTQLAASSTTKVSYATESGYTKEDGGLTKPGVNYYIQVTINKQEITVKATILDWTEVTATGVGEINFTNDITTTGTIDENLLSFDLYQKGTEADANYANVTTYTYSGEPAAWTRNKEIYWPNGTDKFYFRALSPASSTTAMANGSDVLWGTTSKDEANNYNEGDAIAPRTGDVPLTFYHPMAMITVNLKDGLESLTDDKAKLDLKGATIQITNLANTGTIVLQDGSITPGTKQDKMLDETAERPGYYAANDPTTPDALTPQVKNYPVIPQTIGDDARIIITLADGTHYSAQLNLCKDTSTDAAITSWVRGKHYTYTITIGKEIVQFRAEVKAWEDATGEGNATLDWD